MLIFFALFCNAGVSSLELSLSNSLSLYFYSLESTGTLEHVMYSRIDSVLVHVLRTLLAREALMPYNIFAVRSLARNT